MGVDSGEFYERYWQREGGSPADFGFALSERRAKLRGALAGLPSSAEVLDAGCGAGEFTSFLSMLGYSVVGTDISRTAAIRAKQNVPDASFAVASLEQGVPFVDERFAAVWCTEVLEHLFDIHAALSEMNRILGYGGLLVFTTPYHGLYKNLAIALAGFERHYDPYLSHIRFFTRKSLALCLSNAGFSAVSWDGVGRMWPFWMSHFVVARKISPPRPAPPIRG